MYAVSTAIYDAYHHDAFDAAMAKEMTFQEAASYAAKCIENGAKYVGVYQFQRELASVRGLENFSKTSMEYQSVRYDKDLYDNEVAYIVTAMSRAAREYNQQHVRE